MDLSGAGPIQSAIFTLIGVGVLTSPKLTHTDAHLGRNTAALLAATLLPLFAAQATSGGSRDKLWTSLLVSEVFVLPALIYAFFALPPAYQVVRGAYAVLAVVLLLLLPLTIYWMWPKRSKPT